MTTEPTTIPAVSTCGCAADASVCAECRCGACGCEA
jgi:hypothetical protein